MAEAAASTEASGGFVFPFSDRRVVIYAYPMAWFGAA
jgi:hypothetical protein